MDSAIKLLKDVLTEKINPDYAFNVMTDMIDEHKCHPSLILPIYRTIRSLKDNEEADFCGNLRQCLCYYPGSVQVSRGIKRIIERHSTDFGFLCGNSSDAYVDINHQIEPNISDLSSRYSFVRRKSSDISLGDGTLLRCFGYKNYLSLSQKVLMYVIKNLRENETLLACLPTGGGKSLSWELPVISKSINGMAIVVVPTIALACDHEKASAKAFAEWTNKPLAYHSLLNDSERTSVLQLIRNGNISILYISPEALINNQFQEAVLYAARNNQVGMLVVDEAHLIVQWGIRFRPEFQLISAFRNKLEQVAPNGIKSLLLSATLNDDDTRIIKKVFYSEKFWEFRADELRPEPSFYLHKCQNEDERFRILSDIVAKAPKPIIVYAPIPSIAQNYYDKLLETGYKRIALFTGETSDVDRDDYIDDWRNNKIDIMVATSAFGMGVDKGDVRTVITAYIPENMSRYYQEVGRAGRDGYSCLNYWLPCESTDWDIVHNLTKSTTLTCEKLAARWVALLGESNEWVDSDTVWLDINAAPDYLRYSITGETHRGWNKDVILFLLRMGLIEVIDVDKVTKQEYRILVKLLNIPVLENESVLAAFSKEARELERRRVEKGILSIQELLASADRNCFAMEFVEEFPYSEEQCSGCPACRNNNWQPYVAKGKIRIKSPRTLIHDKILFSEGGLIYQSLDSGKNTFMLSSETKLDDQTTNDIIRKLLRRGVNIFILPAGLDNNALLTRIKNVSASNYMLLALEEAQSLDLKWINGIAVLFFSGENRYDQALYNFSERYLKIEGNKVVYVSTGECFIASKQKSLVELVDAVDTVSNLI